MILALSLALAVSLFVNVRQFLLFRRVSQLMAERADLLHTAIGRLSSDHQSEDVAASGTLAGEALRRHGDTRIRLGMGGEERRED